MTIKHVPVCDVFEVVRGVRPVRILVTFADVLVGITPIHDIEVHMGRRALRRLDKLLARAISPPRWKTKKHEQEIKHET